MTTAKKRGPSRPGSSRATSVVGDIRRKREKPYKTETQKILARKKKLELRTSYRAAPAGYTFLPVGTPDLAARCKEISRQQGFPVNVVNAKPVNKHQNDPDKVSHHVHRIGYHFKSEIVDQAREELGYVLHRGNFVKETELTQQSIVAQTMKRWGLRMDQNAKHETPTQVRSAIKELFPKIPDDDLDEIVKHAWEEGSMRVGTIETMELPRRVQLATIARIRHKHTDYDYLLKVFGWREARAMSEPDCLKKLIEWRGENDDGDDNELEEIVRETIVLDDDDDLDDAPNGSEADDEDSDAELGDTSDENIEVTHRVAVDDDLRPESANEASRSFLRRQPVYPRRREQQHILARQKIGEARRSLRDAPPPVPPYDRTSNMGDDKLIEDRNITNVYVPSNGRPEAPAQVIVDGQLYQREPPRQAHQAQPPPYQYQQHHAPQPSYPMQADPRQIRPSPFAAAQPSGSNNFERVVPTIELEDTPPPQRRSYSPLQKHAQRFRRTPPQNTQVIDLTTPPRQSRSSNPSPMRDVQPAGVTYGEPPVQYRRDFSGGRELHTHPPLMQNDVLPTASYQRYQRPPDPEPYDPRQPMLHLPDRETRHDPRLIAHEPYQAPPGPVYITLDGQYDNVQQHHPPYPQYIRQQPYQYRQAPTPQPIHGAPAPVQQMPIDGRR